tara:strand:+ start:238 stop:975 length:738 start_codon:yes stop_codon:yes gene_type:complete
MKKGNILLPLVFGILAAVIIFLIGGNLISTALNLADDQDIATTSFRAIATSIAQSEPGDYCSSAEIKLTRAYMIKAEGNELKLYKQKLEKSAAGDIIGSEVTEEESIVLDMASDAVLICETESPGCSNKYSLADTCIDSNGDNVVTTYDTKEKCETQEYVWRNKLITNAEISTKPGLTLNPDFNREIGDTFCVCNVGKDEELLRALAIPTIGNILDYVTPGDVTIIYTKGWTDLTCDNPVSQFRR